MSRTATSHPRASFILLLLTLTLPFTTSDSRAAAHTVNMANFQFVPRDLNIDVGDSVTWVNQDLAQHDSVSGVSGIPNGIWDSNDLYGRLLRRNESYSFTFATPGSFPYYCTPHWGAQDMNGSVTAAGGNPPPSIAITSPAQDTVFPNTSDVDIQASASDDGSVTGVEFFDGTTSLGTVTTEPFAVTISNLSLGAHTFTARATDNQGATTTSAPVTINVTEAVNTPPDVVLQAPGQNAVFGANSSFSLLASATDLDAGGSVVSVEFFDGIASLGTDNATPFSITVENLAAGAHTLTARATDNQGDSTTSAPVHITILQSGVHVVRMVDTAFEPRTLTVQLGDTVTWVNSGAVQHDTVHGASGTPAGLWDSQTQYGRLMNPLETFSLQFSSPGSFPYYCTPHWASDDMAGTVEVHPPAAQILSIARNEAGVNITYSTLPGLVYHVEANDAALATPQAWSSLETTTATGSTATFIDPAPPAVRFYRVVCE